MKMNLFFQASLFSVFIFQPTSSALEVSDIDTYSVDRLVDSLPVPSADKVWVKVRQPISIEELSRYLKLDEERLARLNDVSEDHHFRPGDWLVVPSQQSRQIKQLAAIDTSELRRTPPLQSMPPVDERAIVRFGDTVVKIAQRYGLTLQELLRLNPGLETFRLVAGERINIGNNWNDPRSPIRQSILKNPLLQADCKYKDTDFGVSDYPVSRKRSVIVALRDKDTCGPILAYLFCIAGSCQVYPSGGKYGFAPGEKNMVSINSRTWSWIGDFPSGIGFQMWKSIKNGSRFAYELRHWVNDYPTGTNYVFIPNGLKDKIYKMSLFKP